MSTMPGLPTRPCYFDIDLDADTGAACPNRLRSYILTFIRLEHEIEFKAENIDKLHEEVASRFNPKCAGINGGRN